MLSEWVQPPHVAAVWKVVVDQIHFTNLLLIIKCKCTPTNARCISYLCLVNTILASRPPQDSDGPPRPECVLPPVFPPLRHSRVVSSTSEEEEALTEKFLKINCKYITDGKVGCHKSWETLHHRPNSCEKKDCTLKSLLYPTCCDYVWQSFFV